MKKIIFLFLAVLASLYLVYALRYYTNPCLCKAVPSTATAIAKVDFRFIEKQLLHEFLRNPFSKFKKKGSKTSLDTLSQEGHRKNTITDAISLPRQLFISALNKDKSIWATNLLKIKDDKSLHDYLHERNYIRIENQNEILYKKKNILFKFQGDSYAVVYCGNQENLDSIASQNISWMAPEENFIKELTKLSGPISYFDQKGNNLYSGIEGDDFFINGRYASSLLLSSKFRPTEASSAFQFAFDPTEIGKTIPFSQKESFYDFSKVNLDTLLQNWDGEIAGQFNRFTAVIDTIITYEYDDDFNKVESISTKRRLTPNFWLKLGINQGGITYMKDKKAIVEEEGKDILAIFPLAKTVIEQHPNYIAMSSGQSDSLLFIPEQTKMYLHLNFSDLENILSYLPADGQYLDKLDKLVIKMDDKDTIELLLSSLPGTNPLLAAFGL